MESKKRSIPMTDGTPVACRQKNAEEFLGACTPGVMAQYGLGLFGRAAAAQPPPRPRRPRKASASWWTGGRKPPTAKHWPKFSKNFRFPVEIFAVFFYYGSKQSKRQVKGTMAEIKYEVVQRIAVLSQRPRGWERQLNLISWNDGDPQYDIRD